MAVQKITFIFRQENARTSSNYPTRITGWSESYYSSLAQGRALDTKISDIGSDRANVLGSDAAIVGYRLQQVDPVGPATVFRLSRPGTKILTSDQPSVAIFANAPGLNTNAPRRITLRGFPDEYVKNGELFLDADMRARLSAFTRQINGLSYRTRIINTRYQIFSISAAGEVLMTDVTPFIALAIVRINGALTLDGRRRGGNVAITTFVNNRQFTVTPWSWGATTRGTATLVSYQYTPFSTEALSPPAWRSTTRRSGRPFGLLVGARRRRR